MPLRGQLPAASGSWLHHLAAAQAGARRAPAGAFSSQRCLQPVPQGCSGPPAHPRHKHPRGERPLPFSRVAVPCAGSTAAGARAGARGCAALSCRGEAGDWAPSAAGVCGCADQHRAGGSGGSVWGRQLPGPFCACSTAPCCSCGRKGLPVAPYSLGKHSDRGGC